MAQSTALFVGLDVHKDSIAVAQATGGHSEPPVFVGAIGTRQADLDRLIRRLQGKAPELRFVYEAGPSDRGRRQTDPSTVVPNPRISAGSIVGSTGPVPPPLLARDTHPHRDAHHTAQESCVLLDSRSHINV